MPKRLEHHPENYSNRFLSLNGSNYLKPYKEVNIPRQFPAWEGDGDRDGYLAIDVYQLVYLIEKRDRQIAELIHEGRRLRGALRRLQMILKNIV